MEEDFYFFRESISRKKTMSVDKKRNNPSTSP
jgi:hypothetical protein